MKYISGKISTEASGESNKESQTVTEIYISTGFTKTARNRQNKQVVLWQMYKTILQTHRQTDGQQAHLGTDFSNWETARIVAPTLKP